MIEIIMDASQLEAFEACPRKWYYSYVLNLIPNRASKAFDVGSYFHEILAFYYSLPIQTAPITDIDERIRASVEFSASGDLLRKFRIKDIELQKFYRQRLVDYFYKYADEDAATTSIAVEQGFSQLLYEDNIRRYILEGKIDFVGKNNIYGLFVRDHKTQSRKDDRWEFNHQVCNYMLASGANYFEYNYLGLQDKLPPEGMRRIPYKPHPGMLDQWKLEVMKTFREMEDYKNCFVELTKDFERANTEYEINYPRRRSACDSSKYGLCSMHKLCSIPDNSQWVPAVMSGYKSKKERWQAWK